MRRRRYLTGIVFGECANSFYSKVFVSRIVIATFIYADTSSMQYEEILVPRLSRLLIGAVNSRSP